MKVFTFLLFLTLCITSCSENQSTDFNVKSLQKKKINSRIKHWKLLSNINDTILKFQQIDYLETREGIWTLTTNNSYFSNFSYNPPPSCGNGLTFIDTVSWVNKNDTIDLFLKYGKIGNIEISRLNKKYTKVNKFRSFELIQISDLIET